MTTIIIRALCTKHKQRRRDRRRKTALRRNDAGHRCRRTHIQYIHTVAAACAFIFNFCRLSATMLQAHRNFPEAIARLEFSESDDFLVQGNELCPQHLSRHSWQDCTFVAFLALSLCPRVQIFSQMQAVGLFYIRGRATIRYNFYSTQAGQEKSPTNSYCYNFGCFYFKIYCYVHRLNIISDPATQQPYIMFNQLFFLVDIFLT